MLRQEVRSSELLWVGYEESTLLLEVEFHSGEIYRYFGVPPRLVLELLEAESIGRFFNAHIRSRFEFEKVR
jgi:KTSC domain-containing protein